MTRICAWCKKQLGEKEPYDDPSETHTICDDCAEKQAEQLANEFLEGYDKEQ